MIPMTVIYFILCIMCFAALVAVTAIVPRRSRLSDYELERRASGAGSEHVLDQRRNAAYADIVSIQRISQAVLLVLFVLLAISAFGWFMGAVVALFVSLQFSAVASIAAVRQMVGKYYDRHEHTVLGLAEKYQPWFKWLRTNLPAREHIDVQSKDELTHVIETTTGIISADEKKMLVASLRFDGKLVREVMTPKSVVDTVQRSEVLGPLVLDGLHKTGHSRFPVIDGDIDHIVGTLYVHDVLTLDTSRKHTAKVESAMSKRVHYIREDQTLKQALAAFLSTHHHLFVVINEYRETVGIITLEDTLETLLGQKIIDEFDTHDDMRQVAQRKAAAPNALNRPKDSTDV